MTATNCKSTFDMADPICYATQIGGVVGRMNEEVSVEYIVSVFNLYSLKTMFFTGNASVGGQSTDCFALVANGVNLAGYIPINDSVSNNFNVLLNNSKNMVWLFNSSVQVPLLFAFHVPINPNKGINNAGKLVIVVAVVAVVVITVVIAVIVKLRKSNKMQKLSTKEPKDQNTLNLMDDVQESPVKSAGKTKKQAVKGKITLQKNKEPRESGEIEAPEDGLLTFIQE
jgi:hypothetical protein